MQKEHEGGGHVSQSHKRDTTGLLVATIIYYRRSSAAYNLWCSRGGTRGTLFLQIFFGGKRRSPKWYRD